MTSFLERKFSIFKCQDYQDFAAFENQANIELHNANVVTFTKLVDGYKASGNIIDYPINSIPRFNGELNESASFAGVVSIFLLLRYRDGFYYVFTQDRYLDVEEILEIFELVKIRGYDLNLNNMWHSVNTFIHNSNEYGLFYKLFTQKQLNYFVKQALDNDKYIRMLLL